jgi:hypothetical protein
MPSTPVAIAEAPRIPIVFVIGGDPVEAGFVGSLGRPGGNVTGVTTLSGEPSVVAAGGDTQQPAHGDDREGGLILAHEPEPLDGIVFVSRANQAAACP